MNQLSELDELTGPAAAAVLDAAHWAGHRRNPAKEWPTTWRRGDAHAWIQGDGPVVQVEFTVWHRDVDEERPIRTRTSTTFMTLLPQNFRASSPSSNQGPSEPGWRAPTRI
ncbi:hypothetical protein ACFWR9_27465 [Streptomyces sp. NPDC058534]|uniref:hypothetical protein n=1 Tax=Streptomyces sp. NPDC058534 TaxID=3346541 RepID=UPI00364B26DC